MSKNKIREQNPQFEYYKYLNIFKNKALDMACSMFRYKNLPYGINSSDIERTLLESDSIAFTNILDDITLSNYDSCYIALPYTCTYLNLYGYPQGDIHLESRYNNINYTTHDYVIGYDNMLRIPLYPEITIQCESLAQLELLKRVNANVQSTPFIVKTTNKSLLSALNKLNLIANGSSYIVEDSGINPVSVEVLNLNAPYLIDKLNEAQSQAWDNILTSLGFGLNINRSRERVIQDEIRSINTQSQARYNSRLTARREFVDNINTKYGLNIEIEEGGIYGDNTDQQFYTNL